GEHALQNGAGFLVLRVVEARRDDAAVDDQEIDVGAGQADRRVTLLAAFDDVDAGALFFAGMDRPGDRHLVYGQLTTLGITSAFQHAHGGLAARIVGVVRIIGPGQQHLARAHVAAEVVDVAV